MVHILYTPASGRTESKLSLGHSSRSGSLLFIGLCRGLIVLLLLLLLLSLLQDILRDKVIVLTG